jgi:hypothetical protein
MSLSVSCIKPYLLDAPEKKVKSNTTIESNQADKLKRRKGKGEG